MATDTSKVSARVFPQWTVKWTELGKAALLAGLSAGLLLIGGSIFNNELPNQEQLLAAGKLALTTALAVIIRDFTKPTITVIKGQESPVANIEASGTVTTTPTK